MCDLRDALAGAPQAVDFVGVPVGVRRAALVFEVEQQIGIEDRDASGKSLPSSIRATIERLRTWDGRSQIHEPIDRNLRQAFSELDRLADKLSVRDAVIEKSA